MWKSTQFKDSIPVGVWLDTKISDSNGERNRQVMKYERGLWWIDGMYVYYWPTHYKEIN